MWYDDADVQIIGIDTSGLNTFEKNKLIDKCTELNQQLRYKNIIKDLQLENIKLKKEILELKEELLGLKGV